MPTTSLAVRHPTVQRAIAASNDRFSPETTLWKAEAAHDRIVLDEVVDGLRYDHVMRRASTWSAKAIPANDNQSWPLLAQLRKDGNEVLVPVAERYRRTFDRAIQNALQGVDVEAGVFNVVQRPRSKQDPSGRTKGPLRVSHTAAQSCGGPIARLVNEDRRKDDDKPNPTRPGVAKSYSRRGDEMAVAVIDAKRDLARLRDALGPLTGPFEEAVLDGDTLTDIGRRRQAGQSSPGAGKLIVMMGLEAVQTEFRQIDRERRFTNP